VQFTYAGTDAQTVELRGDFTPNGWSQGVPMPKMGNAFTTTLQLQDRQVVQYKFLLDGTRWIADPSNPNQAPDGFGGQNSVVTANCGGGAFDWRDAILYFVVVDRFANGDTSNDGAVMSVDPAANYQGGDLEGLRQKIEAGYFDQLHVNAIWMTAPIDNADGLGIGDDGRNYAAYHGYWPTHLDQTEEHVGSMTLLQQVVTSAHSHGLKVLLDYVMNHVHQDSPVYQQHPDWFWPNTCVCGDACSCGSVGCSWDDPNLRKSCWFRPYLPDFNFNNSAARQFSVDNAMFWINQAGVDGYRLDAVKHIEPQWILDLRARVPGGFYMIGETFTGDRNLIKQFVGASQLDGQFDFPLRAQVVKSILSRTDTMQSLDGFVASNEGFYGAGAVMGHFLGNHDLPRAIHLAENSPEFGEWDPGKARGWSNQPQLPTGPEAFQRIGVAYAFLMTTPGVPLLYYGDEIGMAGAGDPDNRRFMQWSGLTQNQTWLHDRIARLAAIRQQHVALRSGSRQTLAVSADGYTYQMSTSGDRVIIALNRGDGTISAAGVPAGTWHELISDTMVTAPLQLQPRSALILVTP
jgi:glycosidase